MKAFIYQGKLYLRAIPGKSLFRSTMVHEVVNRGDIFALCLENQQLTVIPGGTVAEHIDISFTIPTEKEDKPIPPPPAISARLADIRESLSKLSIRSKK